jgi:hemerythrin-like domain-containing protein
LEGYHDSVIQPLRQEHQTLLPHVEALRMTADSLGAVDVAMLRSRLDDAVEFLTGTLMSHAAAEEPVLYRGVEHILGISNTTRTMRRDHEEIRRFAHELGSLRSALARTGLTPSLVNDLRQVFHGLYAVIRLHFTKEEEMYIPLLDAHLRPEGARSLFQRMELAASEARAHPRRRV